MLNIPQSFIPDNPNSYLLIFLLVCAVSSFLVWLLAFVLARMSFIVDKPAEMRVLFAVILSLLCFGIVLTAFLIPLAMEFKKQGISLGYAILWFLLDAAALFLLLSCTTRVTSLMNELRNKGEL